MKAAAYLAARGFVLQRRSRDGSMVDHSPTTGTAAASVMGAYRQQESTRQQWQGQRKVDITVTTNTVNNTSSQRRHVQHGFYENSMPKVVLLVVDINDRNNYRITKEKQES